MQSAAHQRRLRRGNSWTGSGDGEKSRELCESRVNRAFSLRAEVTINPEEIWIESGVLGRFDVSRFEYSRCINTVEQETPSRKVRLSNDEKAEAAWSVVKLKTVKTVP